MVYLWVKTVVGAVLAANFAVPLYTVVSNRYLWTEPMAVLAGNMSLVNTLSGLIVMLIGLYDLFQLKIDNLCRSLQYVRFGFGIGIKAAHVCMAVDQFIAVVYPLQHFPLMKRARRWLFAATWLTGAVHVLFGATVNLLGLETFAESLPLDGGNVTLLFPECRWESSLANVYWIVYEDRVRQLPRLQVHPAGAVADHLRGHRGAGGAACRPMVPDAAAERPPAPVAFVRVHLRGLGVRTAQRQAPGRLQEDPMLEMWYFFRSNQYQAAGVRVLEKKAARQPSQQQCGSCCGALGRGLKANWDSQGYGVRAGTICSEPVSEPEPPKHFARSRCQSRSRSRSRQKQGGCGSVRGVSNLTPAVAVAGCFTASNCFFLGGGD